MQRRPVPVQAALLFGTVIVLLIVVHVWAGEFWIGVLSLAFGGLVVLATVLRTMPLAGEMRLSGRSALPNALFGLAIVCFGLDDLVSSREGFSSLVGAALMITGFVLKGRAEDDGLPSLLYPRRSEEHRQRRQGGVSGEDHRMNHSEADI